MSHYEEEEEYCEWCGDWLYDGNFSVAIYDEYGHIIGYTLICPRCSDSWDI